MSLVLGSRAGVSEIARRRRDEMLISDLRTMVGVEEDGRNGPDSDPDPWDEESSLESSEEVDDDDDDDDGVDEEDSAVETCS